jgi:hypothetical protein
MARQINEPRIQQRLLPRLYHSRRKIVDFHEYMDTVAATNAYRKAMSA